MIVIYQHDFGECQRARDIQTRPDVTGLRMLDAEKRWQLETSTFVLVPSGFEADRGTLRIQTWVEVARGTRTQYTPGRTPTRCSCAMCSACVGWTRTGCATAAMARLVLS